MNKKQNRLRVARWYRRNKEYKKSYIKAKRTDILPSLREFKKLSLDKKINLIYVLAAKNV